MAAASDSKLAVLDDYASLASSYFVPLRECGALANISNFPETIDTRTPDGLNAAVERLKHFEIISSMRERTAFPKELIQKLPNLKLLMNTSLRNRSIDLETAKQQGMAVTGTSGRYVQQKPNHDFDNTTQHTWSLILALTSRIPDDNLMLRMEKHLWQAGFMTSLAGKTLGVLGLGKLGGRAARIAVLGFGMNVIAWSENLTQDKADRVAKSFGLESGSFKVVSKSELFSSSDILSLHLVFSERTKNVVGAKELGSMKKTAFLVNTARAGLIDEDALWDALINGRLAGAASDVWWTEPLEQDSRWRKANFFGVDGRSRLIMSPHMGYVENDVMNSWYREQAGIIQAWSKDEDLSSHLLAGS